MQFECANWKELEEEDFVISKHEILMASSFPAHEFLHSVESILLIHSWMEGGSWDAQCKGIDSFTTVTIWVMRLLPLGLKVFVGAHNRMRGALKEVWLFVIILMMLATSFQKRWITGQLHHLWEMCPFWELYASVHYIALDSAYVRICFP